MVSVLSLKQVKDGGYGILPYSKTQELIHVPAVVGNEVMSV